MQGPIQKEKKKLTKNKDFFLMTEVNHCNSWLYNLNYRRRKSITPTEENQCETKMKELKRYIQKNSA